MAKVLFDPVRYTELQVLRETNKLTAAEEYELKEMCFEKLFDMIEEDPSLKAAFARLKNR